MTIHDKSKSRIICLAKHQGHLLEVKQLINHVQTSRRDQKKHEKPIICNKALYRALNNGGYMVDSANYQAVTDVQCSDRWNMRFAVFFI